MQFFSKWRASQDEEERESSQAFQDDGSPVLDAPAEQHHPGSSTRTEDSAPSGEDVDSGSSPDAPIAGRSRRVSFEGDSPGAAPVIRKTNAVGSQNWRWLLQQEELKSLAELSAPSSSAPRTAAEKNEVRRRAAEELDLSSVKREELYLLSAEELGALDELAYGGEVLQTAFQLEHEYKEVAVLERSTRGDFELATLLQQLEEEEEEAAREDARWDELGADGDEVDEEEERQVARAIELTKEEQEEEDEWKQVERAMARAAEQERDAGAGIGGGSGGRSSDAGSASGSRSQPALPTEQGLVRQQSLQKWASASKRMFPTAYSPEGPVAAPSSSSSSSWYASSSSAHGSGSAPSARSSAEQSAAQSAAMRLFPTAYPSEAAELPASLSLSSNARGKSRAVPRFDNQSANGSAGPMTRL